MNRHAMAETESIADVVAWPNPPPASAENSRAGPEAGQHPEGVCLFPLKAGETLSSRRAILERKKHGMAAP